MLKESERYPNARAVEQAIKDAAIAVHRADPSRATHDIVRQAHHDRFLCRVFSGEQGDEWVLKGGSGLLARVANARRTQDIDLYREGFDKDESLAGLREAADRDLGDFFVFEHQSHGSIAAGANQPAVDGYRVVFAAWLGAKRLPPIKVDLAASVFSAVGVVQAEPANRLPLPRLAVFPYRLYPVANQVADKLTATIGRHNGKPSSREKDLVDLVVLALTQGVEAHDLRDAIVTECRLRGLPVPQSVDLPPAWGPTYSKLAAATAPALGYPTVEAARELIERFLTPVLAGTARGAWNPDALAWES
jgi:hypothetical protein